MKKKLLTLSAFIIVLSAFAVVLQKPINAFAVENDAVLYAAAEDAGVEDECHKPLGEMDRELRRVLGAGVNYITADDIGSYTGNSVFDNAGLYSLIVERNQRLLYETSQTSGYIGDGLFKVPHFQIASRFDLSLMNIEPSPSYIGYSFYYLEQIKYIHNTMSIVNGTDQRTYANCYTDGFISELNNLNEGTITAAEFIKSYGTHIVWSVNYGQTLDYVIKFHVDDADEYEFIALAGDALINGVNDSEYVKKYGKSYKSYHQSIGLPPVIGKSLSEIKQEIGGNAQHVVIEYGDNNEGLVPIWEILPDDYADVATMIKTEYDKQYAELEKTIEDKLAERQAAEAEVKSVVMERKANAAPDNSGSDNQSEEKGCASSFNSSWMLFLIPCAVAVLLVKKKIYINNAKD